MASYSCDAWGNLLDWSGPLAERNPIRYRGYYYDTETGFYYLQSRYYDPQTGRFINADGLITTGQGLMSYNMFAYCLDNPANRVDPSGDEDRIVGVGLQFEADMGNYSVGIEIIVYWDEEITDGGEPVVAIYVFVGFSADTDSLSNNKTLIDYGKRVANISMSILTSQTETIDIKKCLIAIYAIVLENIGGDPGASFSVMAVFGNEGFHTAGDYRGTARSYYGRYKNVKVAYSCSQNSKTIAIGGYIGSRMLFAVGFGESRYEQIY